MSLIVGNIFKHYKGKYYSVLWLFKHTETEEQMVVCDNYTKLINIQKDIYRQDQKRCFLNQ
jgi:hypothetical protein